MNYYCDEECLRFRSVIWLKLGEGHPVKVVTRRLSGSSVFLEYTGRLSDDLVEMVFPDSESYGAESRVTGRVTQRCRDGIWVCFNSHLQALPESWQQSAFAHRGSW